MRDEQMGLFLLYSLPPAAAADLCPSALLSHFLPLFSPPPICPLAPPLLLTLSRLHFASVAAKQAAIAQRGGETLSFLALILLLKAFPQP